MLPATLEKPICEGSIVAARKLLFGVGKIESQVLHVAPAFLAARGFVFVHYEAIHAKA